MQEQGEIVDMMSKFPLGSLLDKRFPKTTPVTTTPARPRSEPCNATPQAQVVVTRVESPVAALRTVVIDLTSVTASCERPKTTPAKRRRQVQFAYELLGTPPEFVTVQGEDVAFNQWDGKNGVINVIAAYLLLPKGGRTRATIRKVLQFVQGKLDDGDDLKDIDAGPKEGAHRSGRKRKMTPELDVMAAKCLQRGYGLEMTTSIIAQKLAPVEISAECVRRSAKKVYSGKCHNRATTKNWQQRQDQQVGDSPEGHGATTLGTISCGQSRRDNDRQASFSSV